MIGTGSIRGERGMSVMAVVFIMAVITFLGLIFVSLFTTGTEVSLREYDSTRALYVAEGGAEAAIGHLKQSPASTEWAWNDGYSGKALGDGTVDVEVLHYEVRDESLTPTACESFTSSIEGGGANDARTIYVTLRWDPALNSNTLDANLYSDNICTTAVTPVSKTTLANAVILRYRMTSAVVGMDYDLYVGVTGNATASQYELRIAHPDNTSTMPVFGASDSRAVIALGNVNDAYREVFKAFCRVGECP
ncbi:MAG: hypothetical protein V3W31_02380 [Thermodesulfobacteriota bacterium]